MLGEKLHCVRVCGCYPLLLCDPYCPEFPISASAQASAKHVTTIAQAFAASTSSRAVKDLAAAPLNNAERNLQKVLRCFDLTLNVPVTNVNLSSECEVPCLMPTDYITTLVDNGFLYRLLGGSFATRISFPKWYVVGVLQTFAVWRTVMYI